MNRDDAMFACTVVCLVALGVMTYREHRMRMEVGRRVGRAVDAATGAMPHLMAVAAAVGNRVTRPWWRRFGL